MSPQKSFDDLVAFVKRVQAQSLGNQIAGHEFNWGQQQRLFDELAAKLSTEDLPVVRGPIFGQAPVAVGFPGMGLYSSPNYKPMDIRHVRSSLTSWRYAIMTVGDGPDWAWVFAEYNQQTGQELRRICLPKSL